MIKSFLKYISIAIICLCLTISLCGCSKTDENKDIEKTLSQIQYLDDQIIYMMNKLNNINFDNYTVKSVEIKKESESGISSSGESGSSSGSSGAEASSESSSSNKGTTTSLRLEHNNILVSSRDEIDWEKVKSDIELLSSVWNVIIVDLYKIGITNTQILGFSNDLNKAIISIKNEDKEKSLEDLVNLYGYLPQYLDIVDTNKGLKDLTETKYNVLKAYAVLDKENWADTLKFVKEANTTFQNVLNNTGYIKDKQVSMNNINVLLKEFENSLSTKDKDIFFIKYKKLMESTYEI
ncbi:MAG: hypothetical protein LBL91_02635 [Lachnospiraceae bacterium]|jgi:hypothetical protein|nr:hypothetical protein [Lachnospiraceae bacterium]